MSLEIKTTTLQTNRNTYANIERRFGDKPASRYQEASYDLQSTEFFHCRPLWQPEKTINDETRTVIVMEDWYDFKDPRQFYYGAYVQQRSKMQEAAENNYAFFEKRKLDQLLPAGIKDKLVRYLVPLRHVEHGANLNNMYACAYGTGTTLTQACLYNAMDRLGIAQYLSRIGLVLDGHTGETLAEAKQYWMEAPIWQGLRAYIEETTVTEDWFEVWVAQDVVLDTLLYDLYYRQFDQWLHANGAQDVAMLTEFMQTWMKESNRWVDAVLKTVSAESDDNREQMEQWLSKWKAAAIKALQPLAEDLLGKDSLNDSVAVLDKRLDKAALFR
ncbi:aromatic/alkene monooxygenase hydroxylase subunit beta [Dasania marina]|uniref:aromatic/alkene monooxygenase hydroxylase subunit beta n=1 Tax=Dasania marina TaxID=471499 RepID=UPI00036A8AE5|nr:aromatic/alkene monooxygenase hydroxylase subunit beta [Dasania marina]